MDVKKKAQAANRRTMWQSFAWIFAIGSFLTGTAVLPLIAGRMFLYAILAGIVSWGCWRLSNYFDKKVFSDAYKDIVNK